MKFFCDQCNAQYMIADEKVGPRGVKVKCKKCSHVIVVKPAGGDATSVDGVGSGAAAASAASSASAPAAAPVPKKAESEISGAFDSLFGGSAGGGGDNAWSNNQTVLAKAPISAAASEKEWYVAIDDAQVGPVDIAEIQQRWDSKEINEDSLAWKAGMPDWIPIADIPQLSYLVTERPQKKAAAGATGGAASTGTAAGSAVAKATAPVEWKPSAASALSSLVQEELAASAVPKDTGASKPPEGVPDLGLPGVGTSDLFGGKVGGATAPADPFAGGGGGGAAWSVPSARPSSGGSGGMYALIGGVIFVLLVLAGAVIFMLARSTHQQPVVVQAPPAASAPVAAAPAAPAATAAAPAAAPAPAAAAAAAAEEGDDEKHGGKPHKAKVKHAGGGGGGGGAAVAEAAPAAPEPAAAPAKAALSRDDIWGVVKANGARAAPCLKAARGRNEIPPGKYTFTLNWVIKPNGAVTNAQLTGPANVIGTSLPGCLAGVVGQWRFPASQAGAPIQNFPFGPITLP